MDTSREIHRRPTGVNLTDLERVASVALGAGAVLAGVRRGSLLGWLLRTGGAALALRGVTGRCAVRRAIVGSAGVEVQRAVTIQRSRGDVYRTWRQLDELPRFMKHVTEVTILDSKRSRWVVDEGGVQLSWTAEIVQDVPGQRLVWRSLPDSDVMTEGVVELSDARGGRGTVVQILLRYWPPAGLGMVAPLRALLSRLSAAQVDAELIRLRQLLETGEIATGASHRPQVPPPVQRAAIRAPRGTPAPPNGEEEAPRRWPIPPRVPPVSGRP